MARLLAAGQAELAQLHLTLAEAHQRHAAETTLQRATMADLLANLTETSAALTLAQARHATDHDRLTRLDQELQLLRDHLAELTGVLAEESAAHQVGLHRAEQALQAEKTGLLQDQARTQTELQRVRSQLRAVTETLDKNPPPPDRSVEVDLPRDQLVSVTALLQGTATQTPGIGADHIQIEAAFASLRSALATKTDLRRQARQDALTAKSPRNTPTQRKPVPARPAPKDIA